MPWDPPHSDRLVPCGLGGGGGKIHDHWLWGSRIVLRKILFKWVRELPTRFCAGERDNFPVTP